MYPAPQLPSSSAIERESALAEALRSITNVEVSATIPLIDVAPPPIARK